MARFNFTNPSRDYNMFNCKNHSIPYISDGDPYMEAEVQNVIYTVYGAGRKQPNASLGPISRQRSSLWDAANIVLSAAKSNGSTHVPTAPSVRTDVMPFAGLFYVRGGWEPTDLLLHCIATPGLGDNAYDDCSYEGGGCQPWEWGIETLACQLLLDSFPSAMMRMPLLDGQAPMPYFETKGFNPGSKTNGLSYAPLQPSQGRFYSGTPSAGNTSMVWDVVEPLYSGAWATLNTKYTHTQFDLKPGNIVQNTESVDWPTTAVTADYSRVILHAVGYGALFVVERAQNIQGSVAELSTGFLMRLAVNSTEATAPASRLQIEPGHIVADNSPMRLPSMHVHHACPSPLKYNRLKQGPDSDEGGIRIYDTPMNFVQAAVAVSWANNKTAGESTPLLSLLHGQASKLRTSSVKSTVDGRGIDATDSTGSRSFCLRTRSPGQQSVACYDVQLDCDILLASRCNDTVEGVALGCKTTAILTASDFTFTKTRAGQVTMGAPVLRPMHKPVFTPSLPVFSDNVSVSLSSREHAEGGAELRYTLDGTDPTRGSTLYTGVPIVLASTTGIKARAFCSSSACAKLAPRSDWAADGTRLSAISYGTFVKSDTSPTASEPAPGPGVPHLQGLCVRVVNSTGSWSELYSFAGSALHAGVPMGRKDLPLQPVAPRCVLVPSQPSTYYSTEWSGFFNASVGGVWSFHAPQEFAGPNVPAGYDLRLWLDHEEVALERQLGGLGAAWQRALTAGRHPFRMVLSDARCYDSAGQNVAGAVTGLWRDFPQPWVLYNGSSASVMSATAPGFSKAELLKSEWFSNSGCTVRSPDEAPARSAALKTDDRTHPGLKSGHGVYAVGIPLRTCASFGLDCACEGVASSPSGALLQAVTEPYSQ